MVPFGVPSIITRHPPMQKKGKDKPRNWLNQNTWLLAAVVLSTGLLLWFLNREPGGLEIEHGKLMAMLQADDPGLRFQNVRVDRAAAEIRGKIVTTDPV